MSDVATWGDSSRYYAEAAYARFRPKEPPSPLEERWTKAMAAVLPEAEAIVQRAFKQWNTILRDHLRNETGLRLSVGDDVRAVPVRVLPGLPLPLRTVLQPHEGAEAYLLNRGFVERAVDGCEFLAANYQRIAKIPTPEASLASKDEILRVAVTARHLLKSIDGVSLPKQIGDINVDVFGAYFFRIPEIRLHWLALAIFARTSGVDLTALTAVVLIHELAHAYTHLGADIDGTRWNTTAFGSTHLNVVEGLAQFYTMVISTKLLARHPAMAEAYAKLLSYQSGPYLAHIAWTNPDAKLAGEIVRASMIEARTTSITALDVFEQTIIRNRASLTGKAASN